ncbi:MAG: type III pantothenate kinase [Candidatus Omnitrophota bacterium]|nr:type III pantothenate kinase [Candidatus Omnitrophota bacterium]
MILIDAGNTRIHYAYTKNNRIHTTASHPTAQVGLARIHRFLARWPNETMLLCSVVPRVTKLFKKLRGKYGYAIIIVGNDIPIPIKSRYHKKEIGADRLIGALGARAINEKTRLIIDCGSAVTFDILSKNGTYEGGFILPGIATSLRALSCCALLPKKITLTVSTRARTTIPHRTTDSIQRGITEGFAAMMNELIKKYSRTLKITAHTPVVITGGDALVIMPHLDFRYHYDPHLVFRGLLIMADRIHTK